MPKQSDANVNGPLTNLSVACAQNISGFVSDVVFPPVNTRHSSGTYFEFPPEAWLRDEAKKRAPCTESVGGDYDLVTKPYNTCKYAYHKDICDDVLDDAADVLDLETAATRFVTQKLLLRKDCAFADAYFKTGVWTTDFDVTADGGGGAWDQPGATPIKDIRDQICAQGLLCGQDPNTIVFARKTWNALLDSPDLIARVGFGTPGNPSQVTMNLVAQLLGLDRVIVASAIKNTAKEGATPGLTNEHILQEGALLVYAAPNPGLMIASAGYSFNWTGRRGTGSNGMRMKRFAMDHLEAMRIEGDIYFEHKLVAPDMGTFFHTTLTP